MQPRFPLTNTHSAARGRPYDNRIRNASTSMYRAVELELEEVDRIYDEQLLRRANMSPFFTSARAPFAMPHELDFTPQAILGSSDDAAIMNAAMLDPALTVMTPLSLDCAYTCLTRSTSPLQPGADIYGNTLLRTQAPSPWRDLSRELLHTGWYDRLRADASYYADAEQQRVPSNATIGSTLWKSHEQRPVVPTEQIGAGKSVEQDRGAYIQGRQGLARGFKQEFEGQADRCEALANYTLCDEFVNARRSQRSSTTSSSNSCHIKEYSPSSAKRSPPSFPSYREAASTSLSFHVRHHPALSESRTRYDVSNALFSRRLEPQRVLREKLFPQQQSRPAMRQVEPCRNHPLKQVHAAGASTRSAFKMIPFPAESFSFAASVTESSRVACKRYLDTDSENNGGYQHQTTHQQHSRHAFKRHSPLPDAHCTAKSKRLVQSASLFPYEWSALATSTLLAPASAALPAGSCSQHSCRIRPESEQQQQRQTQLSYTAHSRINVPVGAATAATHSMSRHCTDQQPIHSSKFAARPPLSFPIALVIERQCDPLPPQGAAASSSHTRTIGAYSPTSRRKRIERYHAKRKTLVFHKRVKYACRKQLAIACPRIKGRFVRKQDVIVAADGASSKQDDLCVETPTESNGSDDNNNSD